MSGTMLQSCRAYNVPRGSRLYIRKKKKKKKKSTMLSSNGLLYFGFEDNESFFFAFCFLFFDSYLTSR